MSKTLKIKYDKLNDEAIITPVACYSSSLGTSPKDTDIFRGKGLWDTGANMCMISQRVIDLLGLQPISPETHPIEYTLYTGDSYLYYVHIGLPIVGTIQDILVGVWLNPTRDTDIIIGMDLISAGDFTFSNFDNKSIFCFRVPSMGDIELS